MQFQFKHSSTIYPCRAMDCALILKCSKRLTAELCTDLFSHIFQAILSPERVRVAFTEFVPAD